MNDEDCRFFQKMANSGHYGSRESGKSRQGIYVFTADGKFLASINRLDPDSVLDMMKRGLRKWKQLPENERRPKSAETITAEHRWEKLRPMDGLVLTSYSRDLHRTAKPDSKPMKTWNVDSAWFSLEETRSLVPADAAQGQTFEFPQVFVSRLCRLHFVDCVKGQTDSFNVDEIAGSRISAKVVSGTDRELKLEIFGNSSGVRKQGKFARGVQTKIVGDAVFNRFEQRFTSFHLVAIGKRWGKTRFNDRVAQQGESPIGFALHLTKPDEPIVIPGIIWAYKAPWVKL